MYWVGIAFFATENAFSHGGGLDSNGGHTQKSTGIYHCHADGCEVPSAVAEPSARYDRDNWRHWIDADGDCQDTRVEILIAAAEPDSLELSADGCRVVAGHWIDPFTGALVYDPGELDIDHLVPLAWAYEHGAAAWTLEQKAQFANDPINLWAVDAGLNRSKGAQGFDEWVPGPAFACQYIQAWFVVLNAYPDLQLRDEEIEAYQVWRRRCWPS